MKPTNLKPDPTRAREGDPLVAVRWRHIGPTTSTYIHELIAADGPVVRRTSVNRANVWAFPVYSTTDWSGGKRGGKSVRRGDFIMAHWSSIASVSSHDGAPGIPVVDLHALRLLDFPGAVARAYIAHRRNQLAEAVTE